MVDINQVFLSNTFKAVDLNGEEPILTIKQVEVKSFDEGQKLNIHFIEDRRTLVCNKVNAKTIGKVFGYETGGWIGKKIQLYNDPDVEFGGRTTGGIRVRTGKKPEPVELDETF